MKKHDYVSRVIARDHVRHKYFLHLDIYDTKTYNIFNVTIFTIYRV